MINKQVEIYIKDYLLNNSFINYERKMLK